MVFTTLVELSWVAGGVWLWLWPAVLSCVCAGFCRRGHVTWHSVADVLRYSGIYVIIGGTAKIARIWGRQQKHRKTRCFWLMF